MYMTVHVHVHSHPCKLCMYMHVHSDNSLTICIFGQHTVQHHTELIETLFVHANFCLGHLCVEKLLCIFHYLIQMTLAGDFRAWTSVVVGFVLALRLGTNLLIYHAHWCDMLNGSLTKDSQGRGFQQRTLQVNPLQGQLHMNCIPSCLNPERWHFQDWRALGVCFWNKDI